MPGGVLPPGGGGGGVAPSITHRVARIPVKPCPFGFRKPLFTICDKNVTVTVAVGVAHRPPAGLAIHHVVLILCEPCVKVVQVDVAKAPAGHVTLVGND